MHIESASATTTDDYDCTDGYGTISGTVNGTIATNIKTTAAQTGAIKHYLTAQMFDQYMRTSTADVFKPTRYEVKVKR